MAGPSFKDLNLARKPDFLKDPADESFFERLNEQLRVMEQADYTDDPPAHPFVFIVGLPRSGTTLLSQVIAGGLEVGYINNLAARFWLAPVTGIRLSKAVFGDRRVTTYESRFGATADALDVHEFGYFWRHWLNKRTFTDIRDAHLNEDAIDWKGLRRVLASMQAQFGAPMSFKNIFGSYHLDRMQQELGNVLYLYVERDPLDVAVSILDARRKYYADIGKWWSYVPPNYEDVIDKDPWTQIAGQVHHLKRYYDRSFDGLADQGTVMRVGFEALCRDPGGLVEAIRDRLNAKFGSKPPLTGALPASFPVRTHSEKSDERSRFAALLQEFERDGR